jgi:hypothetical protein
VIANPLNYHYAFFWDEANAFIGYYKTNKGIATNGAYLGQVNTQSIPLPLNAYSFALVRYDNDYVLVNGYTIEELFIDNNLAGVDPADFNDIPIAELNGLTLNEVFDDGNLVLNNDFSNGTTGWSSNIGTLSSDNMSITVVNNSVNTVNTTLQTSTNHILGQTIYIYFEILLLNGTSSGFTSTRPFVSTTISSPILNQLYKFSEIGVSTQTEFRIQANSLSVSGSFKVIKSINLNLTALGLTSLTKAKLDTYFSIYQNGVNATYYATDGNVSSVNGYYYASGKNLFDTTFGLGGFEIGDIISTTGLNGPSVGTTYTFSNDIYSFTNIVVFRGIRTGFISVLPNTSYFLSVEKLSGVDPTNPYASGGFFYYDSDKNFISFQNTNITFTIGGRTGSFQTTPANTAYIRFRLYNSTATTSSFKNVQLEQATTLTAYEAFATPTTTLNLTFLFGIGNEPNKATMDGYYQDYEDWQDYSFILPLAFNTQTISFETIYFDDGVSTEIERLGSILIFTIIGFTLMIFGFASKRRIFNLLAVGAFVVLGFLLIEFVGFIIILFGLIFVNVYYTFFGEL